MAERRKTAISRKPATRKTTRNTARKTSARKASPKRWSQRVTRESDALDLKPGVFKLTSAKKIAASLKRSAEHSSRRKASAYRSALDADILYQPRRQDLAEDAARAAAARQRRVEAAVWERVDRRPAKAGAHTPCRSL